MSEVEEEKGRGGEDAVICLRDYKKCWQNMTADCVCYIHTSKKLIKKFKVHKKHVVKHVQYVALLHCAIYIASLYIFYFILFLFFHVQE